MCCKGSTSPLYKTKNVLFKKPTAILDLSVLKERKQDRTHVDHNQLDILYHLKSHTYIVDLW